MPKLDISKFGIRAAREELAAEQCVLRVEGQATPRLAALHSRCKAVIGSTRAARRAGIPIAANATTKNVSVAAT
jgi:hypothetical protein